MSVNKEVYLIYGYDFTNKGDFYDFLCEKYGHRDGDKEYCHWVDYCFEGKVQMIDDVLSGNYTYFGYILACIEDDYEGITAIISVSDKVADDLANGIKELVDLGFIDADQLGEPQLILFTHYS